MKIPQHFIKSSFKIQEVGLIDLVKKACNRLSKLGWRDLLLNHGLDITANDLRTELLKSITINRDIPGFHDFSYEGTRGIEPGRPAQSLLFHALASPQVVKAADGIPLKGYPTPAEIEAVENLVYGIQPPSILELRARAGYSPLAVVVFTYEYRPAINSVHQKHADVCFSRVGTSRVGTESCKYIPDARGYLPFDESNGYNIRVIPCRYAAYVATCRSGNPSDFGPLRFQAGKPSDSERKFWVPMHKLFSGSECIRDMPLNVKLISFHVNEKLKRVHQQLGGQGYGTGWHTPDINESPFVFQNGIAEFSKEAEDGEGLVVPVVHKSLVEQAMYKGKPLTYRVPKGYQLYASSVNIVAKPHGGRAAPEYVHGRHRLEKDGSITNLNENTDMLKVLSDGDYEAVHYLDYTGDGFIGVECPELALEIPETLAAYSMVGPVDFFPLVKQTELLQWWQQSVPNQLVQNIWPINPGAPTALCDVRYPANLSLTIKSLNIENKPRPVFDRSDDTMAAIVGLIDSGIGRLTRIDNLVNDRTTFLPDGSSGIFAPGWDTSIDRTDELAENDDQTKVTAGIYNFNNYGLGSPFPEDAMLCSALSSFWPAAAPDITRVFAPGRYATATPLTDDVLGQTGQTPWDGIAGPFIPNPDVKEVEFRSIVYADYVDTAIEQKFNYGMIAKTMASEYAARTLIMARVYTALGAVTREQKVAWGILSFVNVPVDDAEKQKAEQATNTKLNEYFTYRFKMFKHKPATSGNKPTTHKNVLVAFDEMLTIYADPQTVLLTENGTWNARRY